MAKRTKLSTCIRKIRFKDEESARGFASGVVVGQAAYRCNQCLQWHLTSAPRFRGSGGADGLRGGAEAREPALPPAGHGKP
jgi:hypothetical protein